MSIGADFLTEIFEESIVLIFHKRDDVILTRTFVNRGSSFFCCLFHRGSTDDLFSLQMSSGVVWQTRDLHLSRNTFYVSVESSSLLLHSIET